jgi:hypothetical protein
MLFVCTTSKDREEYKYAVKGYKELFLSFSGLRMSIMILAVYVLIIYKILIIYCRVAGLLKKVRVVYTLLLGRRLT